MARRTTSRIKDTIYMLSNSLVDEIKAQQVLAAAEAGELTLEPVRLNSLHLLYELLGIYRSHEVIQQRKLEIGRDAEPVDLVSDKTLVPHVVSNMIEDPLEKRHAAIGDDLLSPRRNRRRILRPQPQ